MSSAGSEASYIAFCFSGCPTTSATPTTPAAAEATEDGWQWSITCLVVTTVVTLLGPRRVVFWLNYITARFETAPEQSEVRVATHPTQLRNGLRAIANMGPGPVQPGGPGAQIAGAPTSHIGEGGIYGWDHS